ncbi:AEC family transporter [Verrucomicrobiaceae bacterium R5-34]|uniref:AEC family transporter n=1 Tax=Oceaniferula flava TaxID=2800421 RepID=A0AAE2SBH7_9BACT|nr:AEC family transporter [Oceaniferula flavus]MBK1830207.1 AEC family transporter [Verrucomicrobiaceae bacterium R5-34]MBK1854798.1 AEC family transporter [Oceaniferula flavus]MBM1136104.1 AEC family transporter [Oceaniferula flavus]
MEHTILVLTAAMPVYLIIVLGAVLRRTKTLTPEMDKGLMTMSVHLFLPCLVLDKMLGVELLRNASVVFSSAGIGFSMIVLAMGLAYVVARLLGYERGGGLRTFAASCGVQNYGFIAIPLMVYVFPNNDTALAVMFTHNLGVDVALWTVGIMLISGNSRPSWRSFIKGPIIAVVVGILMLQTRTDHLIPEVVTRAFSMLGFCAVPVSLLLVGTTMYDLARHVRLDWKVSTSGVLVRLAMVPLVILCLAKFLPLAPELKQVMIIQAAMPAGVFPIVISRHYGGRADIAIQVVVVTTVVSLISMPLIIALGMKWVLV